MIKQPKLTKQDLVVLHGWEGSPQGWNSFSEKVRKHAKEANIEIKIHIPRLPGFGKKNRLEKPYNIDDYASWLKKYLNDNKISNPVLIGHSHGGRVLIRFASHYPNVPHKLVLINAAGIKNTKFLPTLKRNVFKTISIFGKILFYPLRKSPFYEFFVKFLYRVAREQDYHESSPVMKKALINMLSYDATKDISLIKKPALLIWGKHDTATPLWMGQLVQKLLPREAKLKVLDGKHGLHLTHPDELASLVVSELRS